MLDPSTRQEITLALLNTNPSNLGVLFEALGGRHPYGHLRICRALLQVAHGTPPAMGSHPYY